ncbi:hypothetical protein D3879_03060 [Pseudomonas cavernicola]|uniref:Uncharacterized protein n=1 Tax=Pseudomonas cavernicola TaxID=2320866 RepID=A0A418XIN9_9PSED|nr:hypothetical protein D3879_03060 [Pseudomonas cavernicola]
MLAYEKKAIEDNAKKAGLSVAAFLRNLEIGYEVRGGGMLCEHYAGLSVEPDNDKSFLLLTNVERRKCPA